MRTLICAAALLIAGPASAAGNEVSVEMGTLTSNHATYNAFSEGAGMPSYGLRLGLGVTDRVAVIGGYHRVRRGAELSDERNSFGTNYLVDELTLGAKADVPLRKDVAELYATASALGYRGTMRFDGDISRKNNTDQIRSSALSVGALATAGVEIMVPTRTWFSPAVHVEVGYGGALRHRYTLSDNEGNRVAIGEMSVSGVAVRAGVGVRF